ncbi:MAG: MarR family transcriptional regulator [Actinomycetia bacterium]|nr:MarR family transcriptional regulator [Actinomycetes bacterium]
MSLADELHALVRTLDRWAERILRPEGLSYNRYVALAILSQHPGATGRLLAQALRVSEPAASGIVRSLIESGLAENHAEPGDGNVRRLRLTELGQQTFTRCSALLGESLDDQAQRIGIDPDKLARTVRALHDEVLLARSPSTPEQS